MAFSGIFTPRNPRRRVRGKFGLSVRDSSGKTEFLPTVTGSPWRSSDGHADRFGRATGSGSERSRPPTVPADGFGRATVRGVPIFRQSADGHGFAVPICRQSPPTVTPTGSATVTPWRSSDGDRRQAQPFRRSAATVATVCRNRPASDLPQPFAVATVPTVTRRQSPPTGSDNRRARSSDGQGFAVPICRRAVRQSADRRNRADGFAVAIFRR